MEKKLYMEPSIEIMEMELDEVICASSVDNSLDTDVDASELF